MQFGQEPLFCNSLELLWPWLLHSQGGFFSEANHAPSMPDALGSIPGTSDISVPPEDPYPQSTEEVITPALPTPSLHFLKSMNLYSPSSG